MCVWGWGVVSFVVAHRALSTFLLSAILLERISILWRTASLSLQEALNSRPGTWILNEQGPTVTDSWLVLTCQQQQLLGGRLRATLAPLLKANCSAIPWFCELLQRPSHEPFFFPLKLV